MATSSFPVCSGFPLLGWSQCIDLPFTCQEHEQSNGNWSKQSSPVAGCQPCLESLVPVSLGPLRAPDAERALGLYSLGRAGQFCKGRPLCLPWSELVLPLIISPAVGA